MGAILVYKRPMLRCSGSACGFLLGVLPGVLPGLLLGCSPNPNPPVVMVLRPSDGGDLATSQVELQTVVDLTTLKGTATDFVGGAQVLIDRNSAVYRPSLGPGSDQAFSITAMKSTGIPVHASFIDQSGVLWPADFHSWNMVTAFYNFERSFLYFRALYGAKEPMELHSMRVLYWPEVTYEDEKPWVDNVLFLSLIKSFVLVRFEDLQRVPLAMNIGTIGHEVAHRVFNFKALADSALNPALGWQQVQSFNLLKSIDEGFADFHGYGVTCKEPSGCLSAFLKGSIPDANADARDFTRGDLCLDDVTLRELQSSSGWIGPGGKMYTYGTLWASALYHGANRTAGVQAMGDLQKSLIAAYDDQTSGKPGMRQLIGTGDAPGSFTPEAVADVILNHISDDNLKAKVCTEMLTRLRLDRTSMKFCPAGSAIEKCPP